MSMTTMNNNSSSGFSSSFSTSFLASTAHPLPLPSPSSSSLWITREEFNAFYTIDRLLYSRLVFDLDYDSNESIRIVALWLWLERNAHDRYMMCRIFYSSKWIFKALAKEALIIFTCLENKKFPFSAHMNDIPLTRSLVKHNIFSLPFLYQNRNAIVFALPKIVNDIYSRVLGDILEQVHGNKTNPAKSNILDGDPSCKPSSSSITNPNDHQRVYGPSVNQMTPGGVGLASTEGYLDLLMRPTGSYDLTLETQMLKNDVSEAFSFLQLEDLIGGGGSSNIKVVPPDERTIFLTFSKGYPIYENEIYEFFTRKYGDIIEGICMQEVIPEGQPLYARLVVRSASIIDVILEYKGKAKFSINGKHVWARKYVRKSTCKLQSESTPSSPTTQMQRAASPPTID